MCGIFGYVGQQKAVPILLSGLETLEYRGYDSAGIYVPGGGVAKAVGPIAKLREVLAGKGEAFAGTSGIAHTRWATHGPPTEKNAHPHSDASETIHLVHNGIIENWRELKEGLVAQGINFTSDTDTEVLAKLIGTLYEGDLVAALRAALGQVRGAYGLVAISERNPDELVIARLGSPIVIGIGHGEYFVASDPSALVAHTKDVLYLDDYEIAQVTREGYAITTLAGATREKEVERVEWDLEAVQKGGYEHFMLKEINEAPDVLRNTIRGRVLASQGRAKLGGLELYLSELTALERLHIVGCGSAYYAGAVGRTMLETYAKLPVEIELGSEFRYKHLFLSSESAVLAITQSGETADTRASIEIAKAHGARTLGIVNVVGSTIARETDAGVYNHAGPEVAVASTKAFISQLTVLALITLLLGRERGLSLEEGQTIAKALEALPDHTNEVLKRADTIQKVALVYKDAASMMYIGRGDHAAIAAEGALKVKEIAYVHAEAYAGGELKHGPIALLDPQLPVVALAPQGAVYEKMLSNIEEVKARQAPVIAIGTDGDTTLPQLADHVLSVPATHPLLQPILTTIVLHLFAYYIGTARGYNVDRPRNLAKSVTVE